MSDLISRESDYAIRIIAYIAGVNRQVKIAELTENLFITKPIVTKITQQLKKCGILITKTGKNGGLTLIEKIDDISLHQILKCMGFKSAINICTVKPSECKLNPICDITTFFAEIQQDFIKKLKQAKIKDFVFSEKEIIELKSINNRRL